MKEKSEERVKGYKPGTEDWWAEYNMLLPDGKTCYDCIFFGKCSSLYGATAADTKCDFHPNKFMDINTRINF